jgi:hypothetical protein
MYKSRYVKKGTTAFSITTNFYNNLNIFCNFVIIESFGTINNKLFL